MSFKRGEETNCRGLWLLLAALAVGAAQMLGGCENPSLDELLAGKACSDTGECAPGYLCDPSTNLCVPEGTPIGNGGTASGGMGGDGGTGGTGDQGGTGGTAATGGTGGGCQSIADCETPSNPCESPICVGGQCGTQAVPSGTQAPTGQTDGDCTVLVCNGLGVAEPQNDDTDLPVDGNDCTLDECVSGEPNNPPVDVGTPCATAGGSVCDGAGSCVECLGPSDCTSLPPDDECQQRTCEANTCGQQFTLAGTDLAVQVDGDCHVVECDGSGGTVPAIDDSDKPVDGNDCTDDVCDAGVPDNPDKPQGDPCGTQGNQSCDGNGQCIGCTQASDCGTDTFCQIFDCVAGVCGSTEELDGTPLPTGQQIDNDCKQLQCDGNGGVKSAAFDTDTPLDDGNECTDDTCVGGVEQHPDQPINWPCSVGGIVCDGGGVCVACNSPSQCPEGAVCEEPTCANHSCSLAPTPAGTPAPPQHQTDGDCTVVECDGGGGTVDQADPGDVPVDDNDCTTDECSGMTPHNPPLSAGTPCGPNGTGQCDGSGTCDVLQGPGEPCTSPTQCASNYCVDDVCCSSVCDGTCMACSLINTNQPDGTCAPVIAGGDPDGECPPNQTCDGTGSCVGGICGATCTSLGGSCVGNVCTFDCTAPASCPLAVACPVGLPCDVQCTGSSACASGVDCTAASSCNIACGPVACQGPVDCAGSSCTVLCSGTDACSEASCTASSCDITCDAGGTCGEVSCGGDSCTIQCSKNGACPGDVTCSAATSCNIACAGATCVGSISCGPSACTIDCGGTNACGDVDCSSSCACSADCSGNGACDTLTCPTGCDLAEGCDATGPCDTC